MDIDPVRKHFRFSRARIHDIHCEEHRKPTNMPIPKAIRLTQTEREIAEVIGEDALVALMKAYQGMDYVYIPKVLSAEGELVSKMGNEISAFLIENFSRDALHITALPKRIEAHDRNYRLREDVKEGKLGSRDTSVKFGITSRRVRMVAEELGVELPKSKYHNMGAQRMRRIAALRRQERIAALDPDGKLRALIKANPRASTADLIECTGTTAANVKKLRYLFRLERRRGFALPLDMA